jgi:hypothetical protein
MTGDDDSAWRCLELALRLHTEMHPLCRCDLCAMVLEGPVFATAANDSEAAVLRQLFAGVENSQKDLTMKRSAHEKADRVIDVRRLPGCPAHFLENIPNEVAQIVTEACIDELDAHGPVKRSENVGAISHAVWNRVRSIEFERGQKIEQRLHSRHGIEALQLIGSTIRILVGAGDLEKTLIEERRRIDETLKLLNTRKVAAS